MCAESMPHFEGSYSVNRFAKLTAAAPWCASWSAVRNAIRRYRGSQTHWGNDVARL